MPVVEQDGAPKVSAAPTVWAGPYPNVPLAASCTMTSAGGISQAAITMDSRDIHGLSAPRDFNLRHQGQPGSHLSEEGEPVPLDQIAEGELEADRPHEQKPELSL